MDAQSDPPPSAMTMGHRVPASPSGREKQLWKGLMDKDREFLVTYLLKWGGHPLTTDDEQCLAFKLHYLMTSGQNKRHRQVPAQQVFLVFV